MPKTEKADEETSTVTVASEEVVAAAAAVAAEAEVEVEAKVEAEAENKKAITEEKVKCVESKEENNNAASSVADTNEPRADATAAEKPETESAPKPEKSVDDRNGTAAVDLSKPEIVQRKIIEQIEYYFGDINLPRDRFLLEEIKKDNGWIPLTTMLKFKRLAQISSDANVIAEALKHSKLMEVFDDGSKIRRNPETPLPENSLEYWQIVKRRTVYIKGFERDTKLDDILNFVKQFGQVENVMMRREKTENRPFKGSVFVTYKNQETAEAFVNNDTKQYKGNDILKMMQNDYWAKKQKELKEKRLAARAAKQAKKQAAEAESKKKNLEAVHFVKGLVLLVENLPKEDCDLMKVKEFFKQFGDVQYAVYENGDEKAQIRFGGDENGASVAWKAAMEKGEDGKVMFGGNELKGKVLEGQEEEEYWTNFSKRKADKQARLAKNRGNKQRGRGRGGRGRGGGGGGGTRNGEPRGEKRSAEESAQEGEQPEKKPKKIVFPDEE